MVTGLLIPHGRRNYWGNPMSIGPWAFNGFDIVVLLVVFISLAMAASRGLFRELISIAALLGALIISLFVWGRYRFAAQDFIQPDQLADFALGAGTFALTYMLIVFLHSGVNKTLRGKDIGMLDRLTGAAFGAGRALVLASLVVMFMTANYREAKDMQDYNNTLTPEQRAVYQNAPKSVRDMLGAGDPVELPGMLQNSTLYPLLDRIGDGLRALPFAKFRTMAERLKDGESLSEITRDFES